MRGHERQNFGRGTAFNIWENVQTCSVSGAMPGCRMRAKLRGGSSQAAQVGFPAKASGLPANVHGSCVWVSCVTKPMAASTAQHASCFFPQDPAKVRQCHLAAALGLQESAQELMSALQMAGIT